ncbi:hypothetical protein FF1_018654 [Malus domestica]
MYVELSRAKLGFRRSQYSEGVKRGLASIGVIAIVVAEVAAKTISKEDSDNERRLASSEPQFSKPIREEEKSWMRK